MINNNINNNFNLMRENTFLNQNLFIFNYLIIIKTLLKYCSIL